MQSGKPGGFFEGMFRCRDHQKEQIAGTNPLKPLTDGDPTFDPSLDGASEHRASPWCEHANMGGGDDSIGQESRCPSLFGKDVICGIPRTAWGSRRYRRKMGYPLKAGHLYTTMVSGF